METARQKYYRLAELRNSLFQLRDQMDCDRARVQERLDDLFLEIEDAAQEAHNEERGWMTEDEAVAAIEETGRPQCPWIG